MDVCRVDDELCLNPEPHSVYASDPIGKWRQATGVVGEPTKLPFDVFPANIEITTEVVFKQVDTPQTIRTVPAMAEAGVWPFAFSDQLKAAGCGNVVERIAVEGFVRQHIAGAFSTGEKPGRNFRLADIQSGNLPFQGHWPGAIEGV